MSKVINLKKISFRIATNVDYSKMRDLSEENMSAEISRHGGRWEDKFFRQGFHPENTTVVEQEGEFIGFFVWTKLDDSGYLHNVQLKKCFQRQGIGRMILSSIEAAVQAKGLKSIKLQTFRDSTAVDFYKNNGYAIVVENDSRVTMTKLITL
jgi:ribosomal protein S18 acetylase RimI-like enzyme